MSNQKVMRVYFRRPGLVLPGDILQCPACRWKFVLLPDMIHYGDYWDAQTQGKPPAGWEDEPNYIFCPQCGKRTDETYYEELSHTGGIELTNWGKPAPEEKEAKPSGQSRSRKGVSQQRPGEQDRSKANRAKAGGTRGKSDKGYG